MYPDTHPVSVGSEMGQWGAIYYRSTIKIVIPCGKFETSRKNKSI